MSATATLPHRDRLTTPERPMTPAAEVDLAIEHLASLMAGEDGDRLAALEAVTRAAGRLVRARRREVPLDHERPVPVMGSWSLDNSTHIVLGEN
ncbi:MAG: hypothetical protein QOE72_2006 [Chloroflexota bacterium]|nr:hypothetical protein [Chloroflexota bacterium]